MPLEIDPSYGPVNAVRGICKPWIELQGGDEWGDSMFSLYQACHTNHGFDYEDCALFASKLYDNLMAMIYWLIRDGESPWGYGYDEEDGRLALAETQGLAAEARDYWLNGGNLNEDYDGKAKSVIDQMPAWLFEDADINLKDFDVRS
jgi:hypothetical protein